VRGILPLFVGLSTFCDKASYSSQIRNNGFRMCPLLKRSMLVVDESAGIYPGLLPDQVILLRRILCPISYCRLFVPGVRVGFSLSARTSRFVPASLRGCNRFVFFFFNKCGRRSLCMRCCSFQTLSFFCLRTPLCERPALASFDRLESKLPSRCPRLAVTDKLINRGFCLLGP